MQTIKMFQSDIFLAKTIHAHFKSLGGAIFICVQNHDLKKLLVHAPFFSKAVISKFASSDELTLL